AQSVGWDEQRFDVALGMPIDERDAAGQMSDLGEELSWPLIDHRRHMAQTIALRDGDMAGQHDEHAGSGLPGLEQPFAILKRADFAEMTHPLDFLRCQRGEGLLVALKCARRATTSVARYAVRRHAALSRNQIHGGLIALTGLFRSRYHHLVRLHDHAKA